MNDTARRSLSFRVAIAIVAIAACGCNANRPTPDAPLGYCNPLSLNYRFALRAKDSYREGADPTVIFYHNEYWLFASKSGGYWHSADMRVWKFIPCTTLPIETYAPDVHVINGSLCFVAFNTPTYTTTDPSTDHWTQSSKWIGGPDPTLFQDDDGKIYLYSGSYDNAPLSGQLVDPAMVAGPGPEVAVIHGDTASHGWERVIEPHGHVHKPYIEGSWMNKIGGSYYLQYAAPGTEFNSYGDGYCTAASPLGPFIYAANNPFSFKPGGFITGAGHGSTFSDRYENLWHIATMRISVKHMFERRIGLFPAGIDSHGNLFCNTSFGDYPTRIPDRKWDPCADASYGWMLLSYHAVTTASSSIDQHPPELAVDEDIRNYWSAKTGNAGEWLQLDLGRVDTVHAAQVNFAENDCHQVGREGEALYHRYLLEGSTNGTSWTPLVDRRECNREVPHDYVELAAPAEVRFVRITNTQMPGGGTFAISGLRLFGRGHGDPPSATTRVRAALDPDDSLTAKVSWNANPDVTGCNIHWGLSPDTLYESWLVYGQKDLAIPYLNAGQSYWVRVDAFNENGVTSGAPVQVTRR